jgi:nicotinamide-nucleotide amidase
VPERYGAVIYSLGTELTEGIIQDAHGRFLASLLTGWGVRVEKICQLRDAPETTEEVLRDSQKRRLLIFTGGLGPTSDDITREVIAEASRCNLEFRRELWESIRRTFDLSKAEANKRQAYIPEGFTVLPNEWGTAPGFWGETDGTVYVALPGPPRELREMCDRYLGPLLREHVHVSPKQFTAVTTFLIPESVLEDACRRNMVEGVEWRTRVEPFRIHLYIDGKEEKAREAFLGRLQGDMGVELVRKGAVEPAELLLEEAARRGRTVAVAESCTGGMIGEMITRVPGSSQSFWGSAVVYADAAKQRVLGVGEETIRRYGAVSEETAGEMARGVLELSEADTAAAVTGVAGPGGGSEEKPVGTVWIAVCSAGGKATAYSFAFGNRREIVRRRSVTAALIMMEMEMKGNIRVDRLDSWHYS